MTTYPASPVPDTNPPTRPESAGETLRRLGTDGELWAAELAKVTGGILDPTPGGTLHAWLCNAIEAGRSAGYSEGMRAVS